MIIRIGIDLSVTCRGGPSSTTPFALAWDQAPVFSPFRFATGVPLRFRDNEGERVRGISPRTLLAVI
ncbi:MAG TPA: hypothetical protein PLA02_03360 [Brevefilum fermentans]|nr:hypothetical protein [Brevefilum fermentans]